MDISSLIDWPSKTAAAGTTSSEASSAASSPVISNRRQTVSSLLNEDPEPSPSRPVAKTKPKKYDQPPIWARRWNRMAKGPTNININSNSNNGIVSTSPTVSPAVSVSGLPPSITGITPYEDLTRKITEWVYSHLSQLSDDDRKSVEIELKFGLLVDRNTEKRLDLPVVTETMVRPDFARSNTFFKASMSDEQFGRINTFLDDLVNPQKKSNALAPQLNRTNTKTKDVIYEGRGAEKIRLTFDEHEQLVAKITKRRVNDIVIYSPGDLVDIRVSISVEKDHPGQISQQQRPSKVRNKNRLSYVTRGVQIDLTSVISPGSGRQATVASKELELELDSGALISYYDSFQAKTDSRAMDKFEELIRYGLDDARLLARLISR